MAPRLVPGIKLTSTVPIIYWEAGGTECAVWSNLNGAHQHCGKENKTTARVWAKQTIHWGNLAVTARESAPMTTEMKIKLVDFP